MTLAARSSTLDTVRGRRGQEEEGIAQIQQGLEAWRATGAKVFQPYGLALLAEASAQVGQIEEGLTLLAEALVAANDTGERRWDAELYRLKGELLLNAECGRSQSPCATAWAQRSFPPPTQSRRVQNAELTAEECFRQALGIACRQPAKSLELRATISLSRLWQQQGRRTEAYGLLAPVYNWFTEGFDTADLQEARALLDALGT